VRRAGLIVLCAVLTALLCADFVAPHPYAEQFRDDANARPSARYPLGTDALGRDRLSRLLFGGRLSILLAPCAAGFAVILALLAGLTAGCVGGWWERVTVGATDLCLSLPWLFLLLAARAALPLNVSAEASLLITFALLGLLGWAGPSRILLANTRRLTAADFVTAAKASGCSRRRIAAIHILPHLLPVATAQFWVTAPAFLLSEANLGLLGLGIAEPLPSWGGLLRDLENLSGVSRAPWIAVPLAALVLVVACCQVIRRPEEHVL
jgi:peptide/nickel transport system permease protein